MTEQREKLLTKLKRLETTSLERHAGIMKVISDIEFVKSGGKIIYAIDFSEIYDYILPLNKYDDPERNISEANFDIEIRRSQIGLRVALNSYLFNGYVILPPHMYELDMNLGKCKKYAIELRQKEEIKNLIKSKRENLNEIVEEGLSLVKDYEEQGERVIGKVVKFIRDNFVDYVTNLILVNYKWNRRLKEVVVDESTIFEIYKLPNEIFKHFVKEGDVERYVAWFNGIFKERNETEDKRDQTERDAIVLATIEKVCFPNKYPIYPNQDLRILLFTHTAAINKLFKSPANLFEIEEKTGSYIDKLEHFLNIEKNDYDQIASEFLRGYEYFIAHGVYTEKPTMFTIESKRNERKKPLITGISRIYSDDRFVYIPNLVSNADLPRITNEINKNYGLKISTTDLTNKVNNSRDKLLNKLYQVDKVIHKCFSSTEGFIKMLSQGEYYAMSKGNREWVEGECESAIDELKGHFRGYENLNVSINSSHCLGPDELIEFDLEGEQDIIIGKVKDFLEDKDIVNELIKDTNSILENIKHKVDKWSMHQGYIKQSKNSPKVNYKEIPNPEFSIVFKYIRYWVKFSDKEIIEPLKRLCMLLNDESYNSYVDALHMLENYEGIKPELRRQFDLIYMILCVHAEVYDTAISIALDKKEYVQTLELKMEYLLCEALAKWKKLEEGPKNKMTNQALLDIINLLRVRDRGLGMMLEEDPRCGYIKSRVWYYLYIGSYKDASVTKVIDELKNAKEISLKESRIRLVICNNIIWFIGFYNMDEDEKEGRRCKELCIECIKELIKTEKEDLLNEAAIIDTIVNAWIWGKKKDINMEIFGVLGDPRRLREKFERSINLAKKMWKEERYLSGYIESLERINKFIE